EAFGRYLQRSRRSAEAAGRRDLARYLAGLKARGVSSRSAARALSALRGFYAFAGPHLKFREDPTADLESPRLSLALPRALNEEEVESLLAAPDARPLGVRDRAMLELAYACGLRVTELVGLPRDAIDLSDGVLRVTGKGGRQRLVPFGRSARKWLDRYLSEARPGLRRQGAAEVFLAR